MAVGFVQLGSVFENVGSVSLLQNINGGDDIYVGYVGLAAANFATLAGMRARLIAIGGAFTAAYVDQMSFNDMAYAIKVSGG